MMVHPTQGILGEVIVLETTEGVLSTAQAIVLVSAILIVAGLGYFAFVGRPAISTARRYLRVRPLEPTLVGGDDPVAVNGTILEPDESLTGSMSGESCVIYEEINEVFRQDWKYDRDERHEMERRGVFDEEERQRKVTKWHSSTVEADAIPFQVETEHGVVDVDVENAEIDLPTRTVEQSSWIRRFVHRFTFVANLARLTGFVGNPRRRLERHLRPGDEVLVIGDADPAESETSVARVESGNRGGLFVLTTRSRRGLATWSVLGAIKTNTPAAILIVVGTLILVGAAATGVLW